MTAVAIFSWITTVSLKLTLSVCDYFEFSAILGQLKPMPFVNCHEQRIILKLIDACYCASVLVVISTTYQMPNYLLIIFP